MTAGTLELIWMEDELAVHRLDCRERIPAAVFQAGFYQIVRTPEELSLVCPASLEIQGGSSETGWNALKVKGPLDFGLTGILAGLSQVLAAAGISIFAISTYDTDYLLVKTAKRAQATQALRAAGYKVCEPFGAK